MEDEKKTKDSTAEVAWKFMNDFWFKVTFIFKSAPESNSENHQEPGGKEEEEEENTGDDVYLVGDFNNWSQRSHKMKRSFPEGHYSVTLLLSEGYYHYKFLVRGEWMRDPQNHHVGGEFGNSIMFVHMDPKVYGLREQHPPHRDYHRPYSDGGHFKVHCPNLPQDVKSSGLLQRLVFIYLPPSYYSDSERRYPVVYANDGQNIFSTPGDKGGPCRGGWYLDAKLDHFWNEGLLPEFILVGIPNSDFVCIGNRNREYCTSQFCDTSDDPYKRYVTEVVKKEVDDTYRTLTSSENTVVMGASMGGLCAFTLSMNHPDIFGACICMSPSFWYVDKIDATAFDLVRKLSHPAEGSDKPHPQCLVYIDSGDGLGDNCYETKMMKETLIKCGWKEGVDFCYVLDECSDRVDMGITHSESVWKERVLPALQFSFKVKQ